MKTIISMFCFLFMSFTIHANDIKVGSVLIISNPSSNQYKHIELPKKNFIIKKGGIADYSTILNEKVVVSDLTTSENGDIEVVLKRENGKRFFNSHTVLKANLSQALQANELIKP
ncbi:hypothetical protein H0I23_09040 [Cellulophaga sp. HaHaR_3_176]|uniref:hypothetical protein n=1 Tax=Cellulophaga sp. HaHaR_3_176 TaxID=1942464 RepID=UPI001C200532|nr:hypothetical protein [Cellulophaga sp. HaHaR_3_176]QWX82615.1 hypothetical protein H0I23_09040 [Cellulophaga sp. HaHaR_3_176]